MDESPRREIDEIYRNIVNWINALILFNVLTNRAVFVDTMNAIIHRFSIKHPKHKHGTHGAETTDAPGTEGTPGTEGNGTGA